MKTLITLCTTLLLIQCNPTHAVGAELELKYNIHLASYHFNRDYDWNETNLGFGVELSTGDGYIGVGYFKNSYNKDSIYLVSGKDYQIISNFSAGVFLGVATGYKDYREPVVSGFRLNIERFSIILTHVNIAASLIF